MKYYLSFLCLFFMACQKDHKKQESKNMDLFFKKAATYRQGSELEQIYYDSIISLNPNYDEAWFEKSAWSIKIGDYTNYFKYMNKAVELNPKVHIGWRGVVRLYYLRDYEGAIKDFETYMDLYPNQQNLAARGEPVLLLLGKAYWQMEEYETAIEYFNDYIEEETETSGEYWVDINAFLYKGICLYKLANYQDALESFKKGIQYNKKFPEAYYHAGKTLVELRKNSQACDYFLKAKQYAENGHIKRDGYREVFGQLYYEDIVLALQENCK